jgi:pyruvate-formate lyase
VDPVAPIQVVHTFDINFDAVRSYCAQQCVLAGSPDPALCSNNCYANFLQVLMASMVGGVQ